MNKNYSLLDLPVDERPRERLINYGVEVLSLQELLTIVLGRGIQGESVVVTSQKLLAKFGSLQNLQNVSVEDLMSVKGIGKAKACMLVACFAIGKRMKPVLSDIHRPMHLSSLAKLLQDKIGKSKKEYLTVISLDARNRFIAMDIVAIGTVSANLAHPREIFETAIKRHASKIVLSHNHPSGDASPSNEDLFVSDKLMKAADLFDIPLVDHIIVTEFGYYSIQLQTYHVTHIAGLG